MALSGLRLRRSLTLSSSLVRHHRLFSAISSSSSSALPHCILSPSIANSARSPSVQLPINHLANQALSFHSSSVLSLSARSRNNNDDEKISPDTILFEGCDYNHWLITMDFPKDPKPTPEEMVETYVQTLAKVFGSVEEAKKRMYACSTTTYTGFQAVMTEDESNKFQGLPGVVFILPDSYIDPVNKEYGGDKYINGVIIPRPPPVQYGRSQGRYGDRNRNYDRPRYDRQRDPLPAQGNSPYDQQGSMQGDGRNYGAQQNFSPQQNYSPQPNYPPQQNYAPQQNYPPQQNYTPQQNYPPQQNFAPQQNYPQQKNYGPQQNYPPQQSYTPQQNYGPTGQGERSNPMPMGNRDYRGDNRNFGPSRGGEYGQGAGTGYGQVGQRDAVQGEQKNYGAQGQFGTEQGQY
ncbi:multiple organellar RNA editing factor 1, mitochondrial-like [Telopea speciosissima]|uniref:multiple organellar RNA editing factor 1, mitochondrial-like n=1 Tax=Telopea speciosissima TaxID=54955 RepID=UPI001CC74328|nr:multiple organellar RNA editing factor 1, mitochondrial-like [Telopea speciosissima]